MRCFRIVRPAYAPTALSGEGAGLHGGRWNPPDWRCVYTAESRALAALEMLVHLTGKARALPDRILTIDLPDGLIAPATKPPENWNTHPVGPPSQNHGLTWLQSNRFAAIKLPSTMIPQETHLLLNPLAPEFESIRIIENTEFRLDLQLN